jgi:hypothetical protein
MPDAGLVDTRKLPGSHYHHHRQFIYHQSRIKYVSLYEVVHTTYSSYHLFFPKEQTHTYNTHTHTLLLSHLETRIGKTTKE